MSMFRSPLYLDTEMLVPLANYHDIEVMIDVAVTQREVGRRLANAGGKMSVPIPGTPAFEMGGSKGSETEITQARTVKDHPSNALNRLLDTLAREGDITDLSDGVVTRRTLVEIDGDWEVSSATDVGSFLASMVALMIQNPAALKSSEPPAEFLSVMTSPDVGSIVLNGVSDASNTRVLVLLDSGNLAGQASLDDLEGDRTIFGQVDAVIPEDGVYSLEKFFLSGFGRAMRRAINPAQMLEGLSEGIGRPMSVEDLRVPGPLAVVRAIAIY